MSRKIIGHKRVLDMFAATRAKQQVTHAYLFTGPPGVGKFTVARYLAKQLLCSQHGDEPCDRCANCRQMDNGGHPDSKIIVPDGQYIKIEQIRSLQHDSIYSPVEAACKVYIIDQAERMRVEAANCLLKTLEEPPVYARFFLVTGQASGLLPTITSRCQVVQFSPVEVEEITCLLEQRGIAGEKAVQAARLSCGNVGQALWLAEGGLAARDKALTYLKLVLQQNMGELFSVTEGWDNLKQDVPVLFNQLTVLIRDILIVKSGTVALIINDDKQEELSALSELWPLSAWLSLLENIRQAEQRFVVNVNPRLLIESLAMTIGGKRIGLPYT